MSKLMQHTIPNHQREIGAFNKPQIFYRPQKYLCPMILMHSNMFCSLLIFHGNATCEPEAVIWNDKQGDLTYSGSPHRNWCLPQLTQEELRRCFGKNAGEWTGRVEISSRKKSLAVDEARMVMY